MEPVEARGVFTDQVVAVVADQANHAVQVFGLDLSQARVMLSDQRDRASVDQISLAAVTGREQPSPRRQIRRHVDDMFTGFDQALGDTQAEARRSFHRPPANWPGLSKRQQTGQRRRTDGEPEGG